MRIVDFTKRQISRRSFLKGASFGVGIPVLGGVLAACGGTSTQAPTQDTHEMTPAAQSQPGTMTADEMDAMHEAGIKTFLAGPSTQGLGNQPLAPKIENGLKIFELTCTKTTWEVTAGQKPEAWAYNGQVPGPQIRVREGDDTSFGLLLERQRHYHHNENESGMSKFGFHKGEMVVGFFSGSSRSRVGDLERQNGMGSPVYRMKRSFVCLANRLRFRDANIKAASKSSGYFCASIRPCRPPVEQPFQYDSRGARS
jgi:hypothetical protein